MRLRAGGCSDKGQIRDINEDAYACHPRLGLFAVCDGMGGEAAGEVASQLAIQAIVSHLDGTEGGVAEAAGEQGKSFLPRTRLLESALQSANHAIYQESQKNAQRAGMGTTVVGACICDGIASIAHAGDSRAYLWSGQRLEQLTRDHSLVEEKVRAGVLSREQSLQDEDQNVVLRVLGRAAAVEIDLAEVPVTPGDYLLLCTDGLTRMVAETALAEAIVTLGEPQAICDHLVALANQNGGVDNITVVVVQVATESLWQRLFARWRK